LIAARKSLKLSLEKSKAIGLALGKTGPRFDEIEQFPLIFRFVSFQILFLLCEGKTIFHFNPRQRDFLHDDDNS
jgi:hypothetical protein